MPSLDTAIRLIVIGQEILIAAVFLFGNGGRAIRSSGALLMVSFMGYLFMSDDVLSGSLPAVRPFAILMATIVPYCLWLFARALFEAPWPRTIWLAAYAAIAVAVWGIYVAGESLTGPWQIGASAVMHIVALGIVAHALWLAVQGRPDDLMEKRRSFRLLFVAIVSIQVAVILAVELTLGSNVLPAWLELVNVIVISLLTLLLSTPMLRLNADYFELETDTAATGTAPDPSALGVADSVLRAKLLELMDDGFYRETGLTITKLAAKLDHREHQLRRLINGRLGYRNFSAFLNSYRIGEAKTHLADPERARTPVLTIALELGYASLGPFNRAFKTATGTTPTDYRQKNTDSE